MEGPRDANLVGMLVFPLDACPFSRFIKKKKKTINLKLNLTYNFNYGIKVDNTLSFRQLRTHSQLDL